MPKIKAPSMPTFEEMEIASSEVAIIQNAHKGLEPLEDSPALNRLLLKNARKSLEQIHDMTGIPVGEVAERLTSLLDTPSWRDDLMEEKLLIAEINMLVEDIRNRMSRANVEDEGWASMARVQLAAIKTMIEQLDKRRKALDGKLSLLTLQQAQLVGAAIKLAQERAIFNIVKKFPELDEEVIYAEFEEEFPKAIEYLEKNASE